MKKWILLPLLALSVSANAVAIRAKFDVVNCSLDNTTNTFTLSVKNLPVYQLDFTADDLTGNQVLLWCEGNIDQAGTAGTTGYLLIDGSAQKLENVMKVEFNADVCPK